MLIAKEETGSIEVEPVNRYDTNVPQTVAVYDLVAVDAEDEVVTQMRGTFTFQMGLTVIE